MLSSNGICLWKLYLRVNIQTQKGFWEISGSADFWHAPRCQPSALLLCITSAVGIAHTDFPLSIRGASVRFIEGVLLLDGPTRITHPVYISPHGTPLRRLPLPGSS